MKRLIQSGLLGAALMLLASGANAQIFGGGQYPNDPNYRNGRNRGYDDRDYPYSNDSYGYRNDQRGNSRSVVNQVRADLSRASSYSRTDSHEREHFNKAQQALDEFQSRWSQGRFDTGRLDKAVSSMQHLVNSDQLNGRDRSILADDLAALREFRASGGQFGYSQRRNDGYGNNDGYRDYRQDPRYSDYPSRSYPRN